MTELERLMSDKVKPEDASNMRMVIGAPKELEMEEASEALALMMKAYESLEYNAKTFKQALVEQKGALS